jgi:hypothetical protein
MSKTSSVAATVMARSRMTQETVWVGTSDTHFFSNQSSDSRD